MSHVALAQSLAWYEKNAQSYAARAEALDMGSSLSRFLNLIDHPHPVVLDAGCGEGRDVRAMLDRGVRARGIDASSSLISLAKSRGHPEAFSMRRLEDLEEEGVYHGIWCCAALVHHEKEAIVSILKGFSRALRGGGVLWISVKAGTGSEWVDGRHFVYHQAHDLETLCEEAGLDVLEAGRENGSSTAQGAQAWATIAALKPAMQARPE